MFAKKNKKYDFLNMFEQVNKEALEKIDSEIENVTLVKLVKKFFKSFKYQSPQYKIVWIVRILIWFFILLIAFYGAILRIKNIIF